jgi:hypothetical protein
MQVQRFRRMQLVIWFIVAIATTFEPVFPQDADSNRSERPSPIENVVLVTLDGLRG